MAGTQQRKYPDRDKFPAVQSSEISEEHEILGENGHRKENGTDIQRQRKAAGDPAQPFQERQARFNVSFELFQPLVDQIITDMRGRRAAAVPDRGILRQLNGPARHLGFRVRTVLRNIFHNMTIMIPGDKIHFAVSIARVPVQNLFDKTHLSDKLAPIHVAQAAEAFNAVAHGDLVRRLLLHIRADQLLYRKTGPGQPLFNPGERQCQNRSPAL
ncbi:MAG: hypothetical protein BWY31_03991 [Lentisphaerae bacterium ADurb.Bin242]|nr:MAG: hypothetical protein BWY31_03991 [Lentisphaerae bacterium ADurb.Bin242]